MKQVPSTSEAINTPQIRDIEQLWQEIFWDEYKIVEASSLEQVKNFVKEKEASDHYWKVADYRYPLTPSELCEELLKNPSQPLTISFLESLPENTKRAFADLLIHTIDIQVLQKKFWVAMLFRIWHHSYVYGNNHKKLKKYLITLPFVGSEKNAQILEKSYLVQRRIHHHNFDSSQTLLLFEIAKNLSTTLESPEIQHQVNKTLGEGFSLRALSTVNEAALGHTEDWRWKEVNTNEEPFAEDFFDKMSTYALRIINGKERYVKVARRERPEIHQNFAGKEYTIYLDGPFGIGLFQGNVPLAILSFSLKDENTLFIHQIQAVSASYFDRYGRTKKTGVEPITHTLPWKENLYEIAVLLAKKYHCRGIELVSAENNKWTKYPRTELVYDEFEKKTVERETAVPHLSLTVAKQIYDVFAEKNGFKQNEDGNWHKDLA